MIDIFKKVKPRDNEYHEVSPLLLCYLNIDLDLDLDGDGYFTILP